MATRSKPASDFLLAEWIAVAVPMLLLLGYGSAAGALSQRMLAHIALMTVAAPLVAGLIGKCRMPLAGFSGRNALLPSAVLQAVLFFAWHAPHGLEAGHGGLWGFALLFLAALGFWLAIFDKADAGLWGKVAALLLTGKLFCLFAVLLTFAPRVLYGAAAADLADQQLAGLLMIVACPLTYVLAAVLLIHRWFRGLCATHRAGAPVTAVSDNGS